MFNSHFEVFLADTQESRRLHYQIRYDVYCEERGFEEAGQFSSQEEKDSFDDGSVHFIVRDKLSKDWVAAMRLVMPGVSKFPIESRCKLDREFESCNFDGSIAEISRLCLKRDFLPLNPLQEKLFSERLRLRDALIERRKFVSEILYRLLYSAFVYSRQNGVGYWYFLATPALARMVSKGQIPFTPAGSGCDYNGIRFPYFSDIVHSHSHASNNSKQMGEIFSGMNEAYLLYSDYFGDKSVQNGFYQQSA